jgi:hypothetical protein
MSNVPAGTVTSTMIANDTIVNADVNASAAIAGTKISPDFGSQTIATTGVFSHALGAAATPSITFTGDLNTGLYSPGADQVAISTNGTGRLFVDASGNVGVGATPVVPFDIQQPQATQRIYSTTGTNTSHIQFRNTGGFGFVGLDNSAGSAFGAAYGLSLVHSGAYPITFVTNSTERLRITSAGLVGIGTSSPSDKLTIFGGGQANTGIIARFGNSTGAPAPSKIHFTDNYIWDWAIGGNSSGNFVFNSSEVGSTAGTTRMTIAAAGNVGIGTTSPTAPLDVVGIGRFTGGGGYVSFGDNGYIRTDVANELRFQGGTSGTSFWKAGLSSESVRIDNSGRVGIGTTSPGYLLDVAGTINSTAVSGFNTQYDNTTLVPLAAKDLGAGTDEKTWRVAQIQRAAKSLQIGGVLNDAGSVANTSITVVRNGVTIDNIQFATGSSSERFRIDSSGRLLVGTSSDSGGALLQVNGDRIRVGTAKTPASASATGTAGEICWDASYIYVCTATNTWKRTAIATW